MHPSGILPFELLVTVLNFLPAPRAIATCACVSKLWARAAGVAVPNYVDVGKYSTQETLYLLKKPHLGSVETLWLDLSHGLMQGALFARICSEAKTLQECHIRQLSLSAFCAAVLLMPADIRVAGFAFEMVLEGGLFTHRVSEAKCPDLSPLSRLAQLEDLYLMSPMVGPIPHLPGLLHVNASTSDLRALSSVTATLESLHLHADSIDFGQAYTLAHFTCLACLEVWAQRIVNFKPEVLPSTLRRMELSYTRGFRDEDPRPIFPVGGRTSIFENPEEDIPGTFVWIHD